MTKEDLYKKIVEMVPVRSDEKETFRETVRRYLKDYQKNLEELDAADKTIDWDSVVGRVNQLCDAINRAIKVEYEGTRHSAYIAIKNQLDGYKTQNVEIEGLAYNRNIVTVSTGMIAYRMRQVKLEEQHSLKRGDLFHIPMDEKGKVGTQRYSVPGYPCLYLSNKVYGCWEEMGRPVFGTIMVSKLISQQEFRVLDLRIPSEVAWREDMKRCVVFFPLVIASMVRVKNAKDSYKPEYLIPQLLTEWVISRNRNSKPDEEIIGILFTSTRKNKDFDYPDNSYDNYAIPVLKPLSSKKYCRRLSELFHLSVPSYYDLEVLKHGSGISGGIYDLGKEPQEENYRTSHFGEMEVFLSNAIVDKVE